MDLRPSAVRGLALAMAAYSLAAAAVWVWRAGIRGASVAAVILHVAVAAVLLGFVLRRGRFDPSACPRGALLVPWVLWLAAWTEIGWLFAAAPPRYHDGAIGALDLAVFGAHLNLTLPVLWSGPWWREAMTAAYLSYYALILGPPLWLARAGRREAYWRHTSGLIGTYLVAFTIYLLLPVQGPRDIAIANLAADGLATVGFLPRIMEAIFRAGDSSGTAFPSSHCAGAVAAALLCRRYFPARLARLTALWAGLIVVATVHTNNHYAIDSLAGVALAVSLHAVSSFSTKEVHHAERAGHRSHRIHRSPPRRAVDERRNQTAGPGAGYPQA